MARLLAPRLIPWHLLIVAVTILFVVLGFWQLDRHRQLQARNDLIERRIASDPVPYREVAPRLDPDAPEGADADPRFRPVFVDGTFVPDAEVLLRGRSLEGQPGYHVLTPLRLASGSAGADGDSASGRAVLVDRGWIPFQDARPNDPAYAPPAGTVLVLGWLMPEADAPSGPLSAFAPRDPAEGELDTVARADVERLQPQMPVRLDPYVIEAASIQAMAAGEADPAVGPDGRAAPFPRIPPPPAPEPGPHLGYALQWFFFALITVVGYAALLRRRLADPHDRHDPRDPHEPHGDPTRDPTRVPTDDQPSSDRVDR